MDLGTTKIGAYLVDLETGRTLAAKGIMNPQIACGEDVVARLAFAHKVQRSPGITPSTAGHCGHAIPRAPKAYSEKTTRRLLLVSERQLIVRLCELTWGDTVSPPA